MEAIVARVRDRYRRHGLVWHHQGSGKTLLMAFAAAKLRQQADLDAPTILVVLDRLDLIEQVASEFASVGLPGLKVAETKRRPPATAARGRARGDRDDDLPVRRGGAPQRALEHRGHGRRGAPDAGGAARGSTCARRSRTRSSSGSPARRSRPTTATRGRRSATPTTRTGSSTTTRSSGRSPTGRRCRSTSRRGSSTSTSTARRSTRRSPSSPRPRGSTRTERGYVARRASRAATFMKTPARIEAVCADIVDHYRRKVAPLGLKAQVVCLRPRAVRPLLRAAVTRCCATARRRPS